MFKTSVLLKSRILFLIVKTFLYIYAITLRAISIIQSTSLIFSTANQKVLIIEIRKSNEEEYQLRGTGMLCVSKILGTQREHSKQYWR